MSRKQPGTASNKFENVFIGRRRFILSVRSACLYVCCVFSKTCAHFTKFSEHVNCGRGSFLLWQQSRRPDLAGGIEAWGPAEKKLGLTETMINNARQPSRRGRCPKTGRCTRRDESVFLMIRCVLLTYHHSTFRQSAILCLYKFRSLCCCCTPVQVNVFIFSCYPYKFRGTNNIQNRQWPLTCLNVLLAAIQSKIANIIRVLR